MLANIYFCYLSHNCPFEATISVAKVLHQQIVLGLSMPSCIKSSLALIVKRNHFETPLQIAFVTHELAFFPRFFKGTIVNQR
jgi:hypothetical protein